MALSPSALVRLIGMLCICAGIDLFLFKSVPPRDLYSTFDLEIHLAVICILGGIVTWMAGSVQRRLAKDKVHSIVDEKLPAMLYGLESLTWVAAYTYVMILDLRLHDPRSPMMTAFGRGLVKSWSVAGFTGDPVGTFLIHTALVIVGLLLLPGVIGSVLYLLATLLALAFVAFGISLLAELARVSAIGAMVAFIIGAVPFIWFVRSHRTGISKTFWRVAEPVYAIFFDWWLTPLVRRRKDERMMDDIENKRRQCELIVVKLQEQDPHALGDLGKVALHSDTLLERVIERFHDRDRQKSVAERTKLIGLARQYFNEYKAMLDAKDELSLATQDARIRHLKRDKEETELKRDLDYLTSDAAAGKELRALEQKRDKLTKEHEIRQLEHKLGGGADEGPYRQAMNDKKARRLVDIQDHLFESLEHPVSTDMEARLLYKQLRKKIDRHPELSDEEKDELLERLERRWKQSYGRASATPIFEED